MAKRYSPGEVVSIALHVDYGDYIDSSVRRQIWQRERRLSPRQRSALVYTPQVRLQGVDYPSWQAAQFEHRVEHINARPARADLSLERLGVEAHGLRADVSADVLTLTRDAALYVAATDGNRRVFEWQGPYAMGRHKLDLPLLPNAQPEDSGIAAFVQDRRSAEVLQALLLGPCVP